MTRFQMLLKEETGAGFLARMAVMLPVFLIVYHLSAGPVRGRYTLPRRPNSSFRRRAAPE